MISRNVLDPDSGLSQQWPWMESSKSWVLYWTGRNSGALFLHSVDLSAVVMISPPPPAIVSKDSESSLRMIGIQVPKLLELQKNVSWLARTIALAMLIPITPQEVLKQQKQSGNLGHRWSRLDNCPTLSRHHRHLDHDIQVEIEKNDPKFEQSSKFSRLFHVQRVAARHEKFVREVWGKRLGSVFKGSLPSSVAIAVKQLE
ncbi:hypothetical protein ZIOFF_070952 [Zingiber officinale]|uniref:Uncharacterized protein n=1 Tax=Zingiber officinale TaxID=94328 RepID=A0A8J5EB72_ZINOF|nr:hypothetical protein ZIOFF_070952 [Zingiber officinale]